MPRSQNIFIKLNYLKVGTKQILSSEGLDKDLQNYYLEKLSLIEKLESYKLSLTWLVKVNSRERISVYFKYNHDINKTMLEFPEIRKNTMQTSVWYACKKFMESIGKNTVDYIEQDRLEEAEVLFRLSTGDLSLDMVSPKGVTNLLPVANNTNLFYSITDCSKELKFLTQVTNATLERVLKRTDSDKMSFLRYIIESNDPVYAKHRGIIYKLLEGKSNYSFEEALSDLELLG